MRVFKRYLLIPVLVIVIQGCVDNKAHVSVTGKTFQIDANIIPKFVKSGNRDCKIEGTVTIKNVTAIPQKFGAKYLFLKANNELTSRTYRDSNVPEEVNTGKIEIAASSSLSFPAYWIYNVSSETRLKSLQFFLQESD